MNKAQKPYPERLLELEQITPAFKQKYDKEIQRMLEKKLSIFGKVTWIASGVFGLGFFFFFGTVAIIAPERFPTMGRMVFAVGALFGLAWAGLCVCIIKRGALDPRSHGKAAAGISWGISIIVVTWAILFASKHADSIVGIRALCVALAFLIMAAVFMIHSRIQQSELKTREKLLEIEYRLAELAENTEED